MNDSEGNVEGAQITLIKVRLLSVRPEGKYFLLISLKPFSPFVGAW
jgi:hypothetical protein